MNKRKEQEYLTVEERYDAQARRAKQGNGLAKVALLEGGTVHAFRAKSDSETEE